MTEQEYAVFVGGLEAQTDPVSKEPFDLEERLLHCILGISGEGGEMVDAVKRMMYYGTDHCTTIKNLIEEGGDTLFYLVQMCNVLGLTLDDLREANVRKLKTRYPNGFSKDRALNRNLLAEQAAMDNLKPTGG